MFEGGGDCTKSLRSFSRYFSLIAKPPVLRHIPPSLDSSSRSHSERLGLRVVVLVLVVATQVLLSSWPESELCVIRLHLSSRPIRQMKASLASSSAASSGVTAGVVGPNHGQSIKGWLIFTFMSGSVVIYLFVMTAVAL